MMERLKGLAVLPRDKAVAWARWLKDRKAMSDEIDTIMENQVRAIFIGIDFDPTLAQRVAEGPPQLPAEDQVGLAGPGVAPRAVRRTDEQVRQAVEAHPPFENVLAPARSTRVSIALREVGEHGHT